mmetsp:Transcript_19960/g.33409  ORF Transcript_19960/g.33409 Transcript_19960/m.33409 type:complete len:223 (-) Transcript_19960:953-1621(-)
MNVLAEAAQSSEVQQMLETPSTSFPTAWPQCDADRVVEQLKVLSPEECPPGRNGWYTSYPSWQRMTVTQQNKTKQFFLLLTPEVRTRVATAAQNSQNEATVTEANRTQLTTKDDRARLLHLYVDPAAQGLWTEAYGVMDRVTLDARNSADTVSSWDRLAEMFNDYDTYNYQNLSVQYNEQGLKIEPFVPRSEKDKIANVCWGMNPANRGRPLRDGLWVRSLP